MDIKTEVNDESNNETVKEILGLSQTQNTTGENIIDLTKETQYFEGLKDAGVLSEPIIDPDICIIEELTEVAQAITRFKRGRTGYDEFKEKLYEEMGDVFIVFASLVAKHDLDVNRIKERIITKVERVKPLNDMLVKKKGTFNERVQ